MRHCSAYTLMAFGHGGSKYNADIYLYNFNRDELVRMYRMSQTQRPGPTIVRK